MCETQFEKAMKAIETIEDWSHSIYVDGDIEDSELEEALEIVLDKANSWMDLKQRRMEKDFETLDDFKLVFEDIEWFYGPNHSK